METFAGRMTLMSLCFLLLHDARSPCIYPKNSIAVADSRMTTNCEQPAEEHPSIWLDFGDRQGRSQRWSAFLSECPSTAGAELKNQWAGRAIRCGVCVVAVNGSTVEVH
jgi:uncharacterized Zn-finger protein